MNFDTATIALLVWICVSVGMFAILKPLRAFLLTFVVGMLFLPVEVSYDGGTIGSIVISQSLRIDRLGACNIGAVLGTVIFASHVLKRYRFHWVDAAYGVIVVGMFATSVVNGLGPKDGLSNSVDNLRAYLPILILSRLYITTVGELYEGMRAIIGGALVYSVICVGEFRLSPQLHRIVYGYFQHSFDQFVRYDHFRPVGFLRHAIELSFFMGTSAALAGWLWFKGLLKPLWGIVPGWLVVGAIGIGLATTLTFSGYAAFLMAVSLFGVMMATRSRWVLLILPLVAIVWMGGRYTNTIDAGSLLKAANFFDTARGASLEYRLESERANLNAASENFVLGKSATNGIVHGEDGRTMAVDAWWMITLVFFGIVGLAGWYAVWCAGMVTAFLRWGRLTPDLRTLAVAVSIVIGAQLIDFLFNSFPSVLLLMLNAGLVSAVQHYRPMRVVQRKPVEYAAAMPGEAVAQ